MLNPEVQRQLDNVRKDLTSSRRHVQTMASEIKRLDALLASAEHGPEAQAVLSSSIEAYAQLAGFGGETLTYFYEHAHPLVREWALAVARYTLKRGESRGTD